MRQTATDFPGLLVPTPLGFEGLVLYEGRDIRIHIDLDGSTETSSLELARRIAGDLARLDKKCLRLIADESFNSYHVTWRGGDGAPNPATLSATLQRSGPGSREFAGSFKLTSIEVTGHDTSSLQYECGDVPRGASVMVTAFDGAAFEAPFVDLYH